MLLRLIDPLLATIYPQVCHVCRGCVDSHADGVACSDCWSSTNIFNENTRLCEKCGSFSKHGRLNRSNRCGQCDDGHYDAAFACGVYESALAATVVSLKKRPSLPRRAEELLFRLTARVSPDPNSIVVPVPLSKKRKFERGHNQADVIGKAIAGQADLRFLANALLRTDHSPMHRIGMDKKARDTTVKNSFAVAAPRLVDGQHVLLVDDVFTSGSTASHCARVLKKNGAISVKILTLARAVMYR